MSDNGFSHLPRGVLLLSPALCSVFLTISGKYFVLNSIAVLFSLSSASCYLLLHNQTKKYNCQVVSLYAVSRLRILVQLTFLVIYIWQHNGEWKHTQHITIMFISILFPCSRSIETNISLPVVQEVISILNMGRI